MELILLEQCMSNWIIRQRILSGLELGDMESLARVSSSLRKSVCSHRITSREYLISASNCSSFVTTAARITRVRLILDIRDPTESRGRVDWRESVKTINKISQCITRLRIDMTLSPMTSTEMRAQLFELDREMGFFRECRDLQIEFTNGLGATHPNGPNLERIRFMKRFPCIEKLTLKGDLAFELNHLPAWLFTKDLEMDVDLFEMIGPSEIYMPNVRSLTLTTKSWSDKHESIRPAGWQKRIRANYPALETIRLKTNLRSEVTNRLLRDSPFLTALNLRADSLTDNLTDEVGKIVSLQPALARSLTDVTITDQLIPVDHLIDDLLGGLDSLKQVHLIVHRYSFDVWLFVSCAAREFPALTSITVSVTSKENAVRKPRYKTDRIEERLPPRGTLTLIGDTPFKRHVCWTRSGPTQFVFSISH